MIYNSHNLRFKIISKDSRKNSSLAINDVLWNTYIIYLLLFLAISMKSFLCVMIVVLTIICWASLLVIISYKVRKSRYLVT